LHSEIRVLVFRNRPKIMTSSGGRIPLGYY